MLNVLPREIKKEGKEERQKEGEKKKKGRRARVQSVCIVSALILWGG